MKKNILILTLLCLSWSSQAFANSSAVNTNESKERITASHAEALPSISTDAPRHNHAATIGQEDVHNEANQYERRNVDLSEPSSVVLLGVGIAMMLLARRLKAKREKSIKCSEQSAHSHTPAESKWRVQTTKHAA